MQLDDAYHLIVATAGFSAVAFACPRHVSHGGDWPHPTIGFGHTGADVRPGMAITAAEAARILADDLRSASAIVDRYVGTDQPAHRHNALVALVAHVGEAPLVELASRLLAADAGDDQAGHAALAYWRSLGFGGRDNDMRREAEINLWLSGRWSCQRGIAAGVPPTARAEALGEGERGEGIADLHAALAYAGFPVTCGDAYTWVTADAVAAFQRSHGLEPTGLYDAATAAALTQEMQRHVTVAAG